MSHTLIVTFPFVIFLMLNPTVGIISSLNWPDCKTNNNAFNIQIRTTDNKVHDYSNVVHIHDSPDTYTNTQLSSMVRTSSLCLLRIIGFLPL